MAVISSTQEAVSENVIAAIMEKDCSLFEVAGVFRWGKQERERERKTASNLLIKDKCRCVADHRQLSSALSSTCHHFHGSIKFYSSGSQIVGRLAIYCTMTLVIPDDCTMTLYKLMLCTLKIYCPFQNSTCEFQESIHSAIFVRHGAVLSIQIHNYATSQTWNFSSTEFIFQVS